MADEVIRYRIEIDDTDLSEQLSNIRKQVDAAVAESFSSSIGNNMAMEDISNVAMSNRQAFAEISPLGNLPSYALEAPPISDISSNIVTYSPTMFENPSFSLPNLSFDGPVAGYTPTSMSELGSILSDYTPNINPQAFTPQVTLPAFAQNMLDNLMPDFTKDIIQPANNMLWDMKNFLPDIPSLFQKSSTEPTFLGQFGVGFDTHTPMTLSEFETLNQQSTDNGIKNFVTEWGPTAAAVGVGLLNAPLGLAIAGADLIGSTLFSDSKERMEFAEGVQQYGRIATGQPINIDDANDIAGRIQQQVWDKSSVAGSPSFSEATELISDFASQGGFENVRSQGELESKMSSVISNFRLFSQTLEMGIDQAISIMAELERKAITSVEDAPKFVAKTQAMAEESGIAPTQLLAMGLTGTEMIRGTGMTQSAGFDLMTDAYATAVQMSRNPIFKDEIYDMGGVQAAAQQIAKENMQFSLGPYGNIMTGAIMGGSSGDLTSDMLSYSQWASSNPLNLLTQSVQQPNWISELSPDDRSSKAVQYAVNMLDQLTGGNEDTKYRFSDVQGLMMNAMGYSRDGASAALYNEFAAAQVDPQTRSQREYEIRLQNFLEQNQETLLSRGGSTISNLFHSITDANLLSVTPEIYNKLGNIGNPPVVTINDIYKSLIKQPVDFIGDQAQKAWNGISDWVSGTTRFSKDDYNISSPSVIKLLNSGDWKIAFEEGNKFLSSELKDRIVQGRASDAYANFNNTDIRKAAIDAFASVDLTQSQADVIVDYANSFGNNKQEFEQEIKYMQSLYGKEGEKAIHEEAFTDTLLLFQKNQAQFTSDTNFGAFRTNTNNATLTGNVHELIPLALGKLGINPSTATAAQKQAALNFLSTHYTVEKNRSDLYGTKQDYIDINSPTISGTQQQMKDYVNSMQTRIETDYTQNSVYQTLSSGQRNEWDTTLSKMFDEVRTDIDDYTTAKENPLERLQNLLERAKNLDPNEKLQLGAEKFDKNTAISLLTSSIGKLDIGENYLLSAFQAGTTNSHIKNSDQMKQFKQGLKEAGIEENSDVFNRMVDSQAQMVAKTLAAKTDAKLITKIAEINEDEINDLGWSETAGTQESIVSAANRQAWLKKISFESDSDFAKRVDEINKAPTTKLSTTEKEKAIGSLTRIRADQAVQLYKEPEIVQLAEMRKSLVQLASTIKDGRLQVVVK